MSTGNSSDSRRQVTREEIERRAYEIYLQRGGGDGTDIEDWLVAERELLGAQDGTSSIDSGRTPLHTTKTSSTESVLQDDAKSVSETRQRKTAGA
jgi:hypothetical protein